MRRNITSFLFLLLVSLSFAQVNPITIGRSSNVYSVLREATNQIVASDSLNAVLFIHRQDITVWGGGASASGQLRYDLSTDGGSTFTSDIGILNPANTRPARYPQVTLYNPPGNTNPFNAKAVWLAPTLSAGNWDGYVSGTSEITSSSPPASTENYQFTGQSSLLPGGLTEGLSGEFWTVDMDQNDSLVIYKGVYDPATQNVDWGRDTSIFPNYYTGFNGTRFKVPPVIAFSPDGQTGWVAFLGDIVGGSDSTFSPIFLKSSDGGDTWGSPQEIDLRNYGFISDSLRSFWRIVTTNGDTMPISTGRATTGFNFDLTVDAKGNPHLFTVIGTAQVFLSSGSPSSLNYNIYSGIEKFACDITTRDGGATWDPLYVAPVLAFRGSFGTGGTMAGQDNHSQISRTEDGSIIFYSWVDSDTIAANQGIAFGSSDNSLPNLYASALRISDGFRTCYRGITNGDPIWDGAALWPTVSPTVLSQNGTYNVPIVVTRLLTNDVLQPVSFHYFGNEVVWRDENFVHPASLDLSWTANNNCRGCILKKPELTINQINCAGDSSGAISLGGIGGYGQASFSWSNGDTTTSISGMGPGSYSVTIATDPNCAVISDTVTLTEPDSLLTSISQTDESVSGANDGSAVVTATGGNPPYTYLWSNGDMTDSVSDLSPGVYTLTVTDSSGCTSSDTLSILAGVPSSLDGDQADIRRFSVFPNPSSGSFVLEVQLNGSEDLHMEVLDMNGRLIMEKRLSNITEYRTQIELPQLARGVYSLRLKTRKGSISQRLVIE